MMGEEQIKFKCSKCKKEDLVTVNVICLFCKDHMEPKGEE